MFCSLADVDGRLYLTASTTLVRLLLNISIHCTRFILANTSGHTWQPIVDGSLPLSFFQTPKDAQLHFARLGANL
jgi:hypothetical protein